MRVEDLDYELPASLVATEPVEPRDAARMMVIDRQSGTIEHRQVGDLPELNVLQPGDLMVVNESRVLPASFDSTRAATGGRVKALFLRCLDNGEWVVMLEAGGRLQPGEKLTVEGQPKLELLEPWGQGQWRARYCGDEPAQTVLERIGRPPLPPYIQRARQAASRPAVEPTDYLRYNTTFAREPGSVAAPTAGLHFTPELLERLGQAGLERSGVTLHVGLGTFAPIRTDELAAHRMHAEWVHVPADTLAALTRVREAGCRTLVVGTTCVRALESLPKHLESLGGDYIGQTDLYIHPEANFHFRFTDMLLTNFHLPRSTLLAMVASLPGVGLDRLKQWYQHAIDHEYRFYSYGDAMLIV